MYPPPPPQVKTQVHGPAVRVTGFHGEREGEQRAACVRANKPPPTYHGVRGKGQHPVGCPHTRDNGGAFTSPPGQHPPIYKQTRRSLSTVSEVTCSVNEQRISVK